jgi:hypothetical protein
MDALETELARARALAVGDLADAIESLGFECTRCGACCTAERCGDDASRDTVDGEGADGTEPHTATVFPEEIRRLQAAVGSAGEGSTAADGRDGAEDRDGEPEAATADWRDVARPMPYGLSEGPSGPEGETFEWALQTDECGDCTFYAERDGVGACTVHADRPLVCRTYPFSVALGGTSQPLGEAVDREGLVRAHECEGLGREIDRADAESLAAALKERAVRDLEEAIAVRDRYEPVDAGPGEVVVHDSEGAKRPDGSDYG